jgi:type I restriction enzyme S subunit
MKWALSKFEDVALQEKGAIVSGPFGSNISSKFFVDEGVPVIRGNNLTFGQRRFIDDGFVYLTEEKAQEFRNCEAVADDLVFTAAGTIGQVGIIPRETRFDRYIISNKQLRVRCDRAKVNPLFLFLWFTTDEMRQHIVNKNTGCSIPLINLGILRGLPVPVPPIEVQGRIADILSAYDDLIENNRRRMALPEEAARQLYQEWFVRLRFPGYEHTRIIDGVPEGWEFRSLGEIAEVVMGQSPESRYYNETGDGLPFHQGVTDFRNRFVSNRIYTTSQNRIANEGDILCSVRAPVGRLNVTIDKIVIGRGLAAIRSRSSNQSFLFYQLRNHFFKEDLIGTGAIFASVTRAEFEGQKLLTPSKKLIQSFENASCPIDEQLRVLFLQNRKLRLARDMLLPRLMNGEVVV